MPPVSPREAGSLLPGGEQERLRALPCYGLLDTPPEEAFDRVTRLAARFLGVPIALVSLIDPQRQFFKSAVGLPEPVASRRETPLAYSFCQHVVAAEAPLVVEDAREHPLVRDNLAVHHLCVIAYLGVPLRAPTGEVLGSLCVMDHEPRAWRAEDEQTLEELAAVLTSELHLRASVRGLEEERQAHVATQSFTRTALDTIDDIFFVLDSQGCIIRWNRKAREVTGYTDEELVGFSVADFFAEKDRERVADALFDVFRLGRARVEAGFVTKSGHEIPYEFTGALMKDAQGEPTGVCGIGRDIAEQQAAARSLRASETRFRSFVEATAQVVWRADASGAVLELSRAWSTFTGQTPEEVAGWGWTEAVHPEDLTRVTEEWAVYLLSQEPHTREYRVRRHDGTYHWFTTRAAPVFDERGAFVEWVGTCQNVEEQRRAEEALRVSEERLRLALEVVRMGTWDYDIRTGTVVRSARTQALLGVPDGTFEGSPSQPYPLLVEEDRERVRAAMATALEEARAGDGLNAEFRLRDPDGNVRTLRSTGRVCLDDKGVPVRMVGVLLDVTDQKEYEAALIEAKEAAEAARAEAEEVARLKSTLLDNMSHEIRTPLTSILGFAEVLAAEVEGEHQGFAHRIEQNGHRLLDTLNAVLDFAQIEAGRYPLALAELDLGAAVRDAAMLILCQAEAKGLTLQCRLPDEPVKALADSNAFNRIVTNLVSNAIKFTDEGSVTVSVRATPEGVAEVCVEDTGVGIAMEFLPRLFSEFRQESEGDARSFEGNGLGLSISKRLVEMMGGTITVKSAKGVGSTFTVQIPIAADGGAQAPATEAVEGCDGASHPAVLALSPDAPGRSVGGVA